MRRIAGVLWHPRSTMAALLAAPSFLPTWAVILTMWLAPAAWLLSTDVGRQAVVDERVRVIEALGGRVDDAAYAALQASPPWSAYFTSGGRLLLAPPTTLLVALGLVALARADQASMTAAAGLAISVHASVVLAIQQVVAVPFQYLRESLSSATTLAALVPMFDEGSMPALVLGAIDVFGLWWIGLLALGLAAATGRPAMRHVGRLVIVYVGLAIVVAAVMAVAGGS